MQQTRHRIKLLRTLLLPELLHTSCHWNIDGKSAITKNCAAKTTAYEKTVFINHDRLFYFNFFRNCAWFCSYWINSPSCFMVRSTFKCFMVNDCLKLAGWNWKNLRKSVAKPTEKICLCRQFNVTLIYSTNSTV